MRKINSKVFKPAGDIRKVIIRDYYGNTIFKSTVNVADKKNLIKSLLEEARLCGVNINIKDKAYEIVVKERKRFDEEMLKDIREKVKKSIEESNKKIKEYLKK